MISESGMVGNQTKPPRIAGRSLRASTARLASGSPASEDQRVIVYLDKLRDPAADTE